MHICFFLADLRHVVMSSEPVAYSPTATQHNLNLVSYCRTSVAALSGCTAGILGLTGLMGFIFYFLAHGFLSLLLVNKAGSSWNKYFLQRSSITCNGIWGELTTYILFWTFIYGMVHVY
ncbi:Transmembrane protein 93 [Fasciola gigantica]|uniref:ER membrane protein complex subunit 6 n=1 Tax=Fasciola gigantica TaxID=46835 RepID=A0A504YP30_FASGI|nr:Transmembrane protein 93 [Fasciola gigantica]